MKNRIKALREAQSLSQDDLAKRAGTTRQQIFRLEKNQRRLSDVWIERLARALDCDPTELIGAAMAQRVPAVPALPVIDSVQAGDWTPPADPYAKGQGMALVYPATPVGPRAFALEIRGDSMEPEFHAGDRVIVDPDVTPLPGDYVVAKLEDEQETTFKKFRPKGGKGKSAIVELVPLNPDWPVLTIEPKHPGRIVATMVEHHRYRRR
jgi:SOS-response transcriptional repressor LexA